MSLRLWNEFRAWGLTSPTSASATSFCRATGCSSAPPSSGVSRFPCASCGAPAWGGRCGIGNHRGASQKMPITCQTIAPGVETFPTPANIGRRLAPHWPDVGQTLASTDETCPKSAQAGQHAANIGPIWPKLDQHLARLGRRLPQFGQGGPMSGRCRRRVVNLGQLRPTCGQCGKCWPGRGTAVIPLLRGLLRIALRPRIRRASIGVTLVTRRALPQRPSHPCRTPSPRYLDSLKTCAKHAEQKAADLCGGRRRKHARQLAARRTGQGTDPGKTHCAQGK